MPLILEDVIVLIWGPRFLRCLSARSVAAGNIELGPVLSNYNIIVAIAAALAGIAYWALKFTRYGRLLYDGDFRPRLGSVAVNVTVVRHRSDARRTWWGGDGSNFDNAWHMGSR